MATEVEIEVVASTSDADAKIEETKEKLDDLGEAAKDAGKLASKGLSKAAESADNLSEEAKGVTKQMVFVAKSAKKTGLAIKAALASTGIGLFIIALGTVVAFWDEIKGFVTGVNVQLERQIKLQNELVEEQEHALALLNASDKVLKLQGKSQKEINDLKQIEIDKLIEVQTKELELQKNRLQNLKDIQEGGGKGLESFFRIGSALLTNFAITVDKVFAKLGIKTGAAQTIAEGSDSIIESIFGSNEDIKETEDRIKGLELSLARLANTSAGITLSEIVEPKEREKQKRAGLGLGEGEDDRVQKLRDELQELADIDNEFLEEEFRRQQAANLRREDEERRHQEIIKGLKLTIIGQSLRLIEDLAKKGSKIAKAAAIGSIVAEQIRAVSEIISNTAIANAKAVAALPLSGGQPFVTLNTVSAGLGIAGSAVAATKAISDINSDSQSISSSGAPTFTGGGSAAPQFNLVRGTDSNQIAEGIQGQQSPVKAFVVGEDMTTQQQLDRRIASDSSI